MGSGARTLLANREIDAAVLETARGGIIREGLGYDLADVGVVTNISDDHLGLDGVDTLEGLAFVKSLVTEAIRPGGVAVLNAEDPMTPYLLGRTKARTALFYMSAEAVVAKMDSDCIRVFLEDGVVTVLDHGKKTRIVNIQDVPITYGGMLDCNVENSLAAVCALYALAVPARTIAKGLRSFRENTGRFQIFDMNEYKVMLDYAHNPAGYREISKLCKKCGYDRLVGVIGMPGDRPNEAIAAAGSLAAQTFDQIYIKEDLDRRGRKKNEVAEILYRSIHPERKSVVIVDDEVTALRQAMKRSQKGDLIVVLYEHMGPLVNLLGQNEGGQIDF